MHSPLPILEARVDAALEDQDRQIMLIREESKDAKEHFGKKGEGRNGEEEKGIARAVRLLQSKVGILTG